ncbi:MAG TPA: VOC family protein [Sulfuricaulis sp.]|nr:VOC family protein [Sulfuricaulis sp.]
MPRVVHFDISADDPERAIRFYRDVFGWKVEKWIGPFDYWLVKTGEPNEPGIDGGLARREHAGDSIINFVDVASVADISASIVANGGKIVQPKQTIPGIGYLAVCMDTEGNRFGIMQRDESAR